MYDPDNHKAFKVSKKLWDRWENMTHRGDHAGRNYEEVMFIRKGLEKIGSPLAEDVLELERKSWGIVELRTLSDGLTANETTKSAAYHKMALACLEIEAGSDGVVHMTTGK